MGAHRQQEKEQAPPESSTVVLLLGTIGDTTWRMFVPTIGFALIGRYFDDQFTLAPWLMLLGAVIGAGVSAYLVRQQLRKVNT